MKEELKQPEEKDIKEIAWDLAVSRFPYTDEGDLEDDIDAAKRFIYQAGIIKGYDIATTTDRDSMVEKCVEALAKQFAIDYSYDAKICVWKGPYTESIRTALRTVLNPEG